MRGGGKTSLAHLSCVGKDRHKEVTVVFLNYWGGEVWIKQYPKKIIRPEHGPCNYSWCSVCVFPECSYTAEERGRMRMDVF